MAMDPSLGAALEAAMAPLAQMPLAQVPLLQVPLGPQVRLPRGAWALELAGPRAAIDCHACAAPVQGPSSSDVFMIFLDDLAEGLGSDGHLALSVAGGSLFGLLVREASRLAAFDNSATGQVRSGGVGMLVRHARR